MLNLLRSSSVVVQQLVERNFKKLTIFLHDLFVVSCTLFVYNFFSSRFSNLSRRQV